MDLKGIGIMSGSSADAVDIAICEFSDDRGEWKYDASEFHCLEYDNRTRTKILNSHQLDHKEYLEFNREIGEWIAGKIISLNRKKDIDFISYHGHTVFHEPQKGYSTQLGNSETISRLVDIPVISEIRNSDIQLGGQGAPLVPVGERDLFSEFDTFLNFGGICNVSYGFNSNIQAFDVCPFNLLLNELSLIEGKAYDSEGEMAKKGVIHNDLLIKFNNLKYFKLSGPKSIDRLWFEKNYLGLINEFKKIIGINDLLRTSVEHLSMNISKVLNENLNKHSKVLLSGGGTHNTFFIERLRDLSVPQLIIPEKNIIEYKEAIIFAYLGLLKILNIPNCLSSVTGAKKDCSGGIIYGNTEKLNRKIDVGTFKKI